MSWVSIVKTTGAKKLARIYLKNQVKPVPGAHACNPSYSGGRNQEITVQSQPGQIVCKTVSQKKITKIGLVEWLRV
jgi:hypothetical protein